MTLARLGRAARSAVGLAGLVSALLLSANTAQAAWLPPVSTSGGLAAADPQVAVDGNGNVIVAWVSGTTSKDISVAEHPAGGVWTNPVSQISDPVGANSCETPRLAMNSAGAAVLVADCGSGATPMRLATRSIFGTWSGTSTEIPGTGAGADPRLGIDDAGNAVLAWEGAGSTVLSAYRPASSAWSGVTTLSSKAGAETPLEPKASVFNVAISPDGYAFAIWREKREETVGDPVVEVRVARKEKGGAWTASGTLTNNFSTTPRTRGEPQIAINSLSQKLVAWRVENPAVAMFSQTRYSFSNFAGWNTATNISESPAEVEAVKLAIDGSGRGLASWRSFEAGTFRVKAASTATAGGAWSTPGATLGSPAGLSIGTEPAVAVDPGGDGTVVWRAGLTVEAASRPAAGVFGPAIPISNATLPCFSEPVAAMASGGDAVTAWSTSTSPAHIAVAVNDVTPPSVAVAAPAPAAVGSPVTLTATATDAWSSPVTLSWDFGDGGSASGASVSHVYASAGTKAATVTATDGAGNSASAAVTVTVTESSGAGGGGGAAGGGGGGAGNQPGAPTPRPRVQVTAAKSIQTWAKQSQAKAIQVKCKLDVPGNCTAVATVAKAAAKKLGLTVPKGAKSVRIGRGSAAATPGRFAVIKVKLNAKPLTAIAASAQPVPVAFALEGTAPNSDPGNAASSLTLHP